MSETSATPTPVVITVGADGPNMLVGPVEIRNQAGDLVKTAGRVALCRCGASENKPFCDGSHKRIGFTDPGPAAAPAADA
jgi:CDGSH-type Zn-finger protein